MISKLKEKKNQKGFTLMEMLIVVAIIVILIAIMIPTMTSTLEKAREATDAANIRASYAEAMIKYMDGDVDKTKGTVTETYTLTQKKDDWQTAGIKDSLSKLGTVVGNPEAGEDATITVDADGAVTITFTAEAVDANASESPNT